MAEHVIYLIPTPLSADTSPADVLPAPVLDVVRKVKCFFVENLRSARRFLKAVDRSIDIDTLTFYEINEHTTHQQLLEMQPVLEANAEAAVISEAGCPAIADPGASLVEMARQLNFRIVPLTGPSSVILGLMASGFNGQNFAFNGYLPVDKAQRKKRLTELLRRITTEKQTQIFIETPYRNNRLIDELAAEMPPSLKMCVACNLTSPLEKVSVQTMAQWKKSSYDFSKQPAIFLLSY